MCKVVLIDDNPIDHYIMRTMLYNNDRCQQATYTFDGDMIIEYMEEHQSESNRLPDVIFLDLTMPDFSGWDFLEKFERLKNRLKKNIELYVMTSSVRESDKERSTKYACVSSFISKPLSKQMLNSICSHGLV
ncbi:response regulator [Mucilaginibacter ginsenosidivorans]|uniref:Response regulator n=1 Tax=Mucilaginibacter ginsenosidivorans TaxID=398053 RepID=A0A5B8UYA2_9SPHI|nr:response regulator [Mucilaginibacter ginsenosidivorans]QEC63888.1 response regulator [Mucilaginibacter ginsenosidivorans]